MAFLVTLDLVGQGSRGTRAIAVLVATQVTVDHLGILDIAVSQVIAAILVAGCQAIPDTVGYLGTRVIVARPVTPAIAV